MLDVSRRAVRAHGLARYRDVLVKLGDDGVRALTSEKLDEMEIRDVADRSRVMRMAREMRVEAKRSTEHDEDEDKYVDVEARKDDIESGTTKNVDERGMLDGQERSPEIVPADDVGSAAPSLKKVMPAPRAQSKIRVSVRKRPLNGKEMTRKERDICTSDAAASEFTVWEPKVKVDLTRFVESHAFAFDAVYDASVSNDEIYASEVEPLVNFVLERANATCFAYGQTGSGKTYTMQPLPGRAARDFLSAVDQFRDSDDARGNLQLWLSAFEIYGGRVFDLLNARRKLRVLEDSKSQICVVGLQEHCVVGAEAFDKLIERGAKARCVGCTGANSESSRSHAILQLVLKRPVDQAKAQHAAFTTGEPLTAEIFGKLSFIDLAGSERGADTTDNDRQTRIEGAEINKSLLALKECIRALDSGATHVPFRGSKLTEVLRDSFLGDSRTVMIANVSPAEGSCEHTLNTLRYADRVRELTRGSETSTTGSPTASTAGLARRHRQSMQTPRRSSMPSTPRHSQSTITSASTTTRLESRASAPSARDTDVARCTSSAPLATPGLGTVEPTSREEAVRAHDALIDVILGEEDAIIAEHRAHVERSMAMVRREMEFLERVDEPGSGVDAYVDDLETVLAERAEDVARLRERVDRFRALLRQEEALSARVSSAATP